jgi:hypothetical protein
VLHVRQSSVFFVSELGDGGFARMIERAADAAGPELKPPHALRLRLRPVNKGMARPSVDHQHGRSRRIGSRISGETVHRGSCQS